MDIMTKEMEHLFIEWNFACGCMYADKRDGEDQVGLSFDYGEMNVLKRLIQRYCEPEDLTSSKALMEVLKQKARDGIATGNWMNDTEALEFIRKWGAAGSKTAEA